ncbi:hypothetical protein [Aureliella helgolandensis]|uniref:Uncharacterized protein n=1 Tax=Aureliella helgolandensis TaxID=2527968 RepID=A0A518G6J5_9BACT|nr:hypothetical protein [Aureliella helgolandensis]QDV24205.1 hypothetical protein Q31a_25200 [Aureliella helgolandensis]
MSKSNWPQLTPREPASYRIEVEGLLDETWSGRLGGMQIGTTSRVDQKPVTTLTGTVRDQAALMGVLNSLYQMHMQILSVNCTNCDETEETS